MIWLHIMVQSSFKLIGRWCILTNLLTYTSDKFWFDRKYFRAAVIAFSLACPDGPDDYCFIVTHCIYCHSWRINVNVFKTLWGTRHFGPKALRHWSGGSKVSGHFFAEVSKRQFGPKCRTVLLKWLRSLQPGGSKEHISLITNSF